MYGLEPEVPNRNPVPIKVLAGILDRVGLSAFNMDVGDLGICKFAKSRLQPIRTHLASLFYPVLYLTTQPAIYDREVFACLLGFYMFVNLQRLLA